MALLSLTSLMNVETFVSLGSLLKVKDSFETTSTTSAAGGDYGAGATAKAMSVEQSLLNIHEDMTQPM